MQRRTIGKALWCTVAASVAIVLSGATQWAVGEDKEPQPKQTVVEKAKKPRGRLPGFYRHVVTAEQRKQIYTIQAEYRDKIAALRAQLKAITNERNEKIAAVMTPVQLKRIKALRAEARAKRRQERAIQQKPDVSTGSDDAGRQPAETD